jgi:hypothetical protein
VELERIAVCGGHSSAVTHLDFSADSRHLQAGEHTARACARTHMRSALAQREARGDAVSVSGRQPPPPGGGAPRAHARAHVMRNALAQ